MTKLSQSIPHKNRVVICHRRWTPQHVGNDGKERTESVLAFRKTDKIPTLHEDSGRDAWWEGLNEASGHNWSDSTVEGWEEITGVKTHRCQKLE